MKINFRDQIFTNFGYAMMSKEQCLGLLTYHNIEHREPSYIDESVPNAFYIAFYAGVRYAMNDLQELQKFVQEIEKIVQ